jgi:ABC-type cobalamin/Fe3+-siderophores transport system ATPase subunit
MTKGDRDGIAAAMERAGASDFAERALTTLSGGELQRVQIAIGLAQEAPVLTAERLGRIWGADAHLTAERGRTALHVAWVISGRSRT